MYARDAEPDNPVVLRPPTAAFWQAGNLPAAARTVRDWARVDIDRPTPERFASRIYEDMGPVHLAAEASAPPTGRPPRNRTARGGCGCGWATARARSALERARLASRFSLEGMLDLALPPTTSPASAPRVSAAEQDPTPVARGVVDLCARAGADRTDSGEQARRECCSVGADLEVSDLLERVRKAAPRGLSERTAA